MEENEPLEEQSKVGEPQDLKNQDERQNLEIIPNMFRNVRTDFAGKGGCCCLLATMIFLLLSAQQLYAQDAIRKSVVKIHTTQRRPDIFKPWTKLPANNVSGSGVVIDGKRILTNAHVVTYASQVYIQPYQSADKLAAKVVAIAPSIDLALLQLENEEFFDEHLPLPMGEELPKPGDTVNVHGYPMGGTGVSVTEGIVSRIEFRPYYLETSGLRIQVDAALNPGNSGGPALSNGKIVGIVFSSIRKADNIGYLIPVEEITLFLQDVADGVYHGKPMLFDELQTLENDALRAKLGLEPDQTGMVVNRPYQGGKENPLAKWDIISRIGDNKIDNEGKIIVQEDLRLHFAYLIQHLATNGTIGVTVIRDGKEISLDLPVAPERDHLLPYLKDQYPRYFIYGPLVFSPATQDFLRFLKGNFQANLLQRASPLVTRLTENASFEGEELVVVASSMFSHKITKGYDNPFTQVVSHLNGSVVKNFHHFVELLRDVADPYIEFTFAGHHVETTIFRKDEMEAATEEVLSENGIRFQYSEDVAEIWSKSSQ
jgi:S1-C subfamily serine protease